MNKMFYVCSQRPVHPPSFQRVD